MMRNRIIIFIILTGLIACRNNAKEESYAYIATDQATAKEEIMLEDHSNSSGSQNRDLQNVSKKIIRSGNLSIESKDIKASKVNLDQLIKKIGAYYEQENANTGQSYTSYDLNIRIPSNQLDNFLSIIENGKDKIVNKSIRAEDVSLQYYDLESRLKSKRAYLDRYQKMVTSAKSVKDLLEIEEQIRVLQEEIESTETTLRSLKDQVNYSNIQINLFEYQANLPSGSNSFWSRIMESFTNGITLITDLFVGVVAIWPIVIIIIVLSILWKRYRKKRTKNN